MHDYCFETPDWRIVFTPDSAGFPSDVSLKLRDGSLSPVVTAFAPWLKVTLAEEGPGGSAEATAAPFCPEDYEPREYRRNDVQYLEFIRLPFSSSTGETLDGWGFTVTYEIHPEGTVFARCLFHTLNNRPCAVSSFSIAPPMSMCAQEYTWGFQSRPSYTEGNVLQSAASVRGRTDRNPVRTKGFILPQIHFDYGDKGRISKRVEWIMEGQNALFGDADNVSTTIDWADDSPRLRWEFAASPVQPRLFPYQWRNTFGFSLGQTPKYRRHAPARMYHYLSNYKPMPDPGQVEKMAAEGADLLVLHQNWRVDMSNGGWPVDRDGLRELVQDAHSHDMKVALYIRGNEDSLLEDNADWFDDFLEKNRDGIYSDYGGPFHFLQRDEIYPGGRIQFHRHYQLLRRLKEEAIGSDGIYINHTGPSFTAFGLSGYADCYTAGEGENGVMVSGRRQHAYYSASAALPSALWTAAFPTYATRRSLPFMANLGQTPHLALGVQHPTSSLNHPEEPGCVTFARPLWKLYGLLDGETNLYFANDLCAANAFATDSYDTGVSLFRTQDGAVLILGSNFSKTPRNINFQLDYAKLGIPAPDADCRMFYLDPDRPDGPPERQIHKSATVFAAALRDNGICGWLICPPTEKWARRLAEYARPYPPKTPQVLAWEEENDTLWKLRFQPRPAQTLYLRLSTPDCYHTLEPSVWWDLYNIQNELYTTPEGGQRQFVGYLSMDGFVTEPPSQSRYIFPGLTTPWIALHDILPAGRQLVEIKSKHLGEDFYSFVEGQITIEAHNPEGQLERYIYKIAFSNAMDEDRSSLTFFADLQI